MASRSTSRTPRRGHRRAPAPRRHSPRRSGRDERRLTRPILRGPQPRPLDARDDGGSKLRSCLCHGARALLLGRRRGASCLRLGRARHHARSPWVARREHPVQPKKGIARRRHHCRQTRETLYRRHHALRDATSTGVLHAGHHEAVATHAQARQREGRTREVAAQSLACEIIVGGELTWPSCGRRRTSGPRSSGSRSRSNRSSARSRGCTRSAVRRRLARPLAEGQ